jgi:hypothetical protein
MHVIFEFDEIRKYHPLYNELMNKGEEGKSVTSKAVLVWREMCLKQLKKSPKNFIYSIGHLDNSHFEMTRALRNESSIPYKIELRYVLAPSLETEIAVYSRFRRMIDAGELGRLPPHQVRAKASMSLFESIKLPIEEGLIDTICAYDRYDTNPIFVRDYPFRNEENIRYSTRQFLLEISRNLPIPKGLTFEIDPEFINSNK